MKITCDNCGQTYDDRPCCPSCGPLVGKMQVGGPSICASASGSASCEMSAPVIDHRTADQKHIEEKLAERLDIGKQYFKGYYAKNGVI